MPAPRHEPRRSIAGVGEKVIRELVGNVEHGHRAS